METFNMALLATEEPRVRNFAGALSLGFPWRGILAARKLPSGRGRGRQKPRTPNMYLLHEENYILVAEKPGCAVLLAEKKALRAGEA